MFSSIITINGQCKIAPHVFPECVRVGSQGLRVSIFDKRNDLLHSPARRVLPRRAFALATVWTVGWVGTKAGAKTPTLHFQKEVVEHHITGARPTIPVSIMEASRARHLSARAPWQGAAAATVTVEVLVLRRGDIEGGVAGIHQVAFGVHQLLAQEVIGHWGLCWWTGSIIRATLALEMLSL